MKVLVTGATGFVGRALVRRLQDDAQHLVVAAVRTDARQIGPAEIAVVGDLHGGTDWRRALQGVDVVVHAAGRAHIMNETVADPLAVFRRVNVEATQALAQQAAECGVRRLIFLSSVKVNGESTQSGQSFGPDVDAPPIDAYGLSKWEAEQGLRQLSQTTALDCVMVRPPLVYGPGVGANFQSMMRWVYRGVPLPLGAIDNRRSLVALDNLVDLIVTLLDHPSAQRQTFMVSDGEDLSTTDLLKRLSHALQRPARLWPVPPALLRIAAASVGRAGIAQRLCDSLQVDISRTRQLLNWQPPVSVDAALKKTADHWLATHS